VAGVAGVIAGAAGAEVEATGCGLAGIAATAAPVGVLVVFDEVTVTGFSLDVAAAAAAISGVPVDPPPLQPAMVNIKAIRTG